MDLKNSIEVLSMVLGSSVLSSILTLYFGKLQNDKNIKIENIVKERRNWRDKIRNLSKEVNEYFYSNEYEKIRTLIVDFETRLNPIDRTFEDQKIIATLYQISNLKHQDIKKIDEFNKRIALLLKHDWERVKKEIKINFFNNDTKRFTYKKLETK